MNRVNDRTLSRWLRYEQLGDDVRAERILGELMSSLPPATVPTDFADRVLVGSGVVRARRAPWFRVQPWVWRTAFATWMVSSFVVVLWFSGFLGDLIRSGQALVLGSRAMIALSRFGAEILTAMSGLLRAGSAVSKALSGPGTLVLVLACALASLLALRALTTLVVSDRSTHHA